MKAIVVEPGVTASLRVEQVDEPVVDGSLLVETVAIGVCGTDHEIIERGHGAPPVGADRLVLGHESLGRVIDAPDRSGFSPGDLVVGVVRRPDPEPCTCCAVGQWDMCLNGGYSERGIKGLDGYGSERFALEPAFAVAVDERLGLLGVLVEPTSIVTKAWRKVEGFAAANCRTIDTALVTGAGPIGVLAAMIGRGRGVEVHVLDHVEEGVKPDLVAALGATYHSSLESCPSTDVVIECTGAPSLIPAVLMSTARNSVVCLTGVSESGMQTLDVGELNRELVLENDIVFGSVNANKADYEEAIQHLMRGDKEWLRGVITRRVPLTEWRTAYDRQEDDVKTIIAFSSIP